jgi:sulfur-oxidizing protein SoxY
MDRAEAADQGRRGFLELAGGAAFLGLLVAAAILGPSRARAAEWNRAAFEAKSVQGVLEALGAGTPAQGGDVVVSAPDIAENGAAVQITAVSNLPRTESIAILVEQNPSILAASFQLSESALPVVLTRVKMAQTSNVSVLVKAGGNFYLASKKVEVTQGGCGGEGVERARKRFSEDPIKIRASLQGDTVEVKVLVSHEMESGQRKDPSGAPIPAHFVRAVTAERNGKSVLAAQWGPSVSKNPYLVFKLAGGAAGDKVRITWADSEGDTRTDEARVE